MRTPGTIEKIGQLLIVGFDATAVTPRLQALLEGVQPAGVILFSRNIVTPQQTHKLLRECRAISTLPLFTCVDMEGGSVDRFRNVIGPGPSAAEVFSTGDRRLFKKHGKVIGESCRAMGFNVDLAPVVDLAFPASQKVMSSRAVAADPKSAALYAREFLAGLRSAGVLGALKHFPGLGEANLDTHHGLPSVNQPWKKLWAEDLAPYRILRRDAPLVLVGHAAYPAVTRNSVPASLSRKWITDILRRKIGFPGLVLSDDLEMGGVLKAAPIEQAAVEHIRAGGDLCLICHQAEYVVRAYEALIHEAQRDRGFARRVQESARRVLAFKEKSAEVKRNVPSPSTEKVDKLARRLWEFSEQVRLETIQRQAEA